MIRVDRRGARFLRLCLVVGLVVSGTTIVRAHTLGENYIWVNVRSDSIDGRFEIRANDLQTKIGVPVEGKGPAALASVRTSAPRVHDYIRRHFRIASDQGQPYTLEFTREDVLELPEGLFAQYFFRVHASPVPDRLQIHHSMLFENERMHRGLLLVEYNEKTRRNYGADHIAMVFGPAAPDQELDLTNVPQQLHGRDMIWQGVLHIWLGIDHVLFLVALLLPTVVMLIGSAWGPVPAFPRALWNVLKIVTVFTVAHSITLLLAAFGLLQVPSRLVESMIALSIALVALNNITGRVREGSLLVILVLGLFHGLGFASVMGHLPFRNGDLLRVVVGFNIGVELGQIAIVGLLFPVLFLLRRQDLYMPVILKGGSAILIAVSAAWFVQRAFGLG